MTKLFQSSKLAVLVLVASAFLFSCTDVDKTLGVGFIPTDELRDLKIDTIYPDAYTISLDSISTMNNGLMLLGTDADPIFGSTVAGSAFQVLPVLDSVDFGNSPTYTSLVLTMPVSQLVGDPTVAQTITVYELTKRLYIDSVYYPVTPMTSRINSTPVGTITYNGNGEDIKITLDPDMGRRLLAAPDDQMIRADTLSQSKFLEFFKGLYVVAQPVGSTHRMNYIASNGVRLTLSYKNDASRDSTCVYIADAILNSGAYATVQFNTVKHDYSQASPGLRINHLNDTTSTAVLDSVVYLGGLYGATPYIKLKKEMISSWMTSKNLKPEQVAISRAQLVMESEEYSNFDITKYPTKLATPTTWYPYWVGSTFFGWLPSFYSTALFDGSLNRTHKTYTFNITYELGKMLHSGEAWKFWLSSYTSTNSSNTTVYSIGQYSGYRAVLRGTKHSKPVKLIITYTEQK